MLAKKTSLTAVLILGTAGLLPGLGAAVAKARSTAAGELARDATTNVWETRAGIHTDFRRATRLIGEPLKNTQGAKLGTIDDLVLMPELNNVSYAVLTRGGLFGLGQRQYAIPWSAMRAGVGDAIVAPIDEQELKQDHGFRANLWPAEGNPRWLSRPGQRTEQVTFDVQPVAEQKDIRRRRVTNLLGMRARDPQDNRVGRVEDMLVAVNTGEIPFTIINYGGMMGIGNRYTAVPANSIELRPAENVARVRVGEQIPRANAFDPDHFPDLADPIYAQRIYTAYEIRPQDPDWVVLGYVPPEPPAAAQTSPPTKPQPLFPAQPQPTQPAQTPLPNGRQTPLPNGVNAIRNEYLAAFTPDKLRTLEGVVTGVSTFQQVGTNAEWVQLQVRTDDGELATVHLGPRDYVGRQDFYVAANDRIKLTGAQATAWRQPIILPITATVGSQSITLRDQTGHPLWDKILPQSQPPAQGQTQQPQQEQPPQDNTPPAPQGDDASLGPRRS